MVVFTCNRCGESLKKKDVEKHCYGRCRGTPFLTCVDCLKDFREDYSKHFLCISEDNRYSANGLKSTTLTKQQRWTMLVHQTCDKVLAEKKMDKNAQALLQFLSEYPSIPDKEKAFRNFATNFRKYNANTIQSVWQILLKVKLDEASKPPESKVQEVKLSQPDTENVAATIDQHDNTNQDMKSKQSNHKKSLKEEKKQQDSSTQNLSFTENVTQHEQGSVVTKTDVEDATSMTNLTKREKKEKKKREKYESQLLEVLNENKSSTMDVEFDNSETGLKKKKKKRACFEACENGEHPERKIKKRKLDGGEVCNKTEDSHINRGKQSSDLKSNTEDKIPAISSNVDKFSWEGTILQVLKSKGERELSLKRLSKKVINEYLVSLGENAHVDEAKISSKFHKKLSKMHSLLVHKDKVKLKTSSD